MTTTTEPIQGQKATCTNCGTEIAYDTFRNTGSPEPDYDPFDDPVTWRHVGSGYAACPSSFANPGPAALTFDLLRKTNVTRCDRWHSGFPKNEDGWGLADWSNAMQGESGELAEAVHDLLTAASIKTGSIGNLVKKMRRIEGELVGNRGAEVNITWDELADKVGEEAADVNIYLDLLLAFIGRSLGQAVAAKFNKVSEELGFPERLPA